MNSKMIDVEKAWQEIRRETLISKPVLTPYSEQVAKARELLLDAQNLLAAYEVEKSAAMRESLAEMFNEVMAQYKQQMYQTKN
jgi:predicted dithiol-disulfide oxidoreductase (DUF899 family)